MKKRTKKGIVKSISRFLVEHPSTILQVSKELNINWETTRNAIELLTEIGFVKIAEKRGKKTIYQSEESGYLWRKRCEVYLQKIERMKVRNEELRKALIDCELSKYHCKTCAKRDSSHKSQKTKCGD